jgi:prevent-host-death family protein
MSLSAPASEVQKNFGAYHDKALSGEAVRVTKYGRETVYIVSAATFHALKQARRDAVAAAELTDAEFEAIETTEIPAGERYNLDNAT